MLSTSMNMFMRLSLMSTYVLQILFKTQPEFKFDLNFKLFEDEFGARDDHHLRRLVLNFKSSNYILLTFITTWYDEQSPETEGVLNRITQIEWERTNIIVKEFWKKQISEMCFESILGNLRD